MQFLGSNPTTPIQAGASLPGRINYILGKDPTKWHTKIPAYSEITYSKLYSGIDLTYGGSGDELKGTYTLAPGADPALIHWSYPGAQAVTVDKDGNLLVEIPGTPATPTKPAGHPLAVTEKAPAAWQDIEGSRRPVNTRYQVGADSSIGFRVDGYDTGHALTIDPALTYSTYVGGTGGDQSNAIAVDAQGNAYITGFTAERDYPTTSGAMTAGTSSYTESFVTKLSADGTKLIYSTYLSGTNSSDAVNHIRALGDAGTAAWVDRSCGSACNAFVVGYTHSLGFPTTPNSFQTTMAANVTNAYLVELNSDGSGLVYSTLLGGTQSNYDAAEAVVVRGSSVFMAGNAQSPDFPTTANAFMPTSPTGSPNQAFFAKINPSLPGDGSGRVSPTNTQLEYSTFLGGTTTSQRTLASGIGVDPAGIAVVTGSTTHLDFPTTSGAVQPGRRSNNATAFVTKIRPDGKGSSDLAYSTYLGGSGGEGAQAVAVDGGGAAYVAGTTSSMDFPTTANAPQRTKGGGQDAFVTKLNSALSRLAYSTYLGGDADPNPAPGSNANIAGNDEASGIAIDGAGNAYVTGSTASSNFPGIDHGESSYRGCLGEPSACRYGDAFVTKVAMDGSAITYSRYLGGTGDDIGTSVALDQGGSAYITGATNSSDFPTTANAYQTSGHTAPVSNEFPGAGYNSFVTKLAGQTSSQTPTPSPSATTGQTPAPTPTPTATATPAPSPSPSPSPSASPSPSSSPSGGQDSPWVDVHPGPTVPPPPDQRTHASMAYRPESGASASPGKLVLFGGCCTSTPNPGFAGDIPGLLQCKVSTQGAPFNCPPSRGGSLIKSNGYGDTWTWDRSAWHQEAPLISPPPRLGAAMAYHAATGKVVLFGGIDADVYSVPMNDTWTWDGKTWQQEHPAHSPPSTHTFIASMAPDPAGKLVLFGGADTGNNTAAETWTWDGADWLLQHPKTSPPARYQAGMAYDDALGRTVLFGGDTNPTTYSYPDCHNDPRTWVWDGSNWAEHGHPRNTGGSDACSGGTAGSPMAYLAATNQVVLYTDGGQGQGNTWTWDGDNWRQRNPQLSPPSSSSLSMAYFPPSQYVLLFFGGPAHDTWTWDGKPAAGGLNTATNIRVSLDPDRIPADGVSTSTATAIITAGGQGVPHADPRFTTDGDVTFGSVVDHGDGTYTTTITASTTADTENIEASLHAGQQTAFNLYPAVLHETPAAARSMCSSSPSSPPLWTDLDPNFGCGGRVSSAPTSDTLGGPMVVQPDGRIVASSTGQLVRFLTDGTIDPTFGTQGVVPLTTHADHAIALQSDGKVLIADRNTTSHVLYRFLPDGSPDMGFGVNGQAPAALNPGVHGLLIQPDGKLLLYGRTDSSAPVNPNDVQPYHVARYSADGQSLDAGFGAGGVASFLFPGIFSGQGIALQPDGRIVVDGGVSSGDQADFGVARLTPSGVLDRSFNPCTGGSAPCGGTVVTSFGPGVNSAIATAITVQTDGKLVAAGYTGPVFVPGVGPNPAGRWGYALARYMPDGSLERSFNPCVLGATPCGGQVITDHFQGYQGRPGYSFGPSDAGYATDVAIQPDGRILVAGFGGPYYNTDFLIARYNPDGTLDSCRTPGYVRTRMLNVAEDALVGEAKPWSVAIQPDGKILAGGWVLNQSQAGSAGIGLARYLGGGPPPPPTGTLPISGSGCGDGPAFQGPVATIGKGGTYTRPPAGTHVEAKFAISLSKPAGSGGATVHYSTADGPAPGAVAGKDYEPVSSGKVTIPAGKTSGIAVVRILGAPGSGGSNRKTFAVKLTDVPEGTIYGPPSDGDATIVDPNPATTRCVNVSDPSVVEPGAGDAPAYFTVALGGLPAAGSPVTVDYTTRDKSAVAGRDFTATHGTVTFTREEMQRTQRADKDVVVPVLSDSTVEGNRDFEVVLSKPVGTTICPGQGVAPGHILEYDTPGTPDVPGTAAVAGTAATLTTTNVSGTTTPPVEPVAQGQVQAQVQVQAQAQQQAQEQAQAQAQIQAGMMQERQRQLQLEKAHATLQATSVRELPGWGAAAVWVLGLGIVGYGLARRRQSAPLAWAAEKRGWRSPGISRPSQWEARRRFR